MSGRNGTPPREGGALARSIVKHATPKRPNTNLTNTQLRHWALWGHALSILLIFLIRLIVCLAVFDEPIDAGSDFACYEEDVGVLIKLFAQSHR